MAVLPAQLEFGLPYPLGASVSDLGVNFAVFSDHAKRIELCIFDQDGNQELRRFDLNGPTDGIFHGQLAHAKPGLVYGFRAYGDYAPQLGHRFNPNKVLLDPYARAIVGRWYWDDAHYGYQLGAPDGARSYDGRDNAAIALKAQVLAPTPAPPAINVRYKPEELVLYEMHVKGFSKLMTSVPAEIRGTYAGLAHANAIAHLKALGVSSISLLPVHQRLSEPHLSRLQLNNYWGYNTIGFFCADPRLAAATGPQAIAAEFKAMVAALHEAGIEVILDVVYNHTPEAGETGPTISMRGLDNASYYRALSDDPARAENYTGCGNTINAVHPRVTQLILDSLRFWVSEMGVDGFRFDLAPVLGRTARGHFDPAAAFFVALRQDPVLAKARLIAEAWDVGPQSYQVGRFPSRFQDWNDRFRDAMRRFWLGKEITRGEFARRFLASSDLFHHGDKKPWASVNFITAHDGFTLEDLVSFNGKHNLANGENNADGKSDEICFAFGTEGQSDDAKTLKTRALAKRALLASLLFAQGTPMLLAGDEMGHSQGGNNNAYCQDNLISWLNWQQADQSLVRYVRDLLALRRSHALLRHAHWFSSDLRKTDVARVHWLTKHGVEMGLQDWHNNDERALAAEFFSANDTTPSLRILFNPHDCEVRFGLSAHSWQPLFNSAIWPDQMLGLTGDYVCPARSVVLLATSTYLANLTLENKENNYV
jgi:isoamylase